MPRVRTRRTRTQTALTVLGLFQGYLVYNVARKALGVTSQELMSDGKLNLTEAQLGLLSTCFTLAYGLSKFVSAVASDFISSRSLFVLGLVVTSLASFGAAFTAALLPLCVLSTLHGAAQGIGWPALASICLSTLSEANVGKGWALLTSAGYIGSSIGPAILTLSPQLLSTWAYNSWSGPFLIAGAAAILSALFSYILLCEPLRSGNMLQGEVRKKEEAALHDGSTSKSNTSSIWHSSFMAIVLANGLVLFVQKAIGDWSFLFLRQASGMSPSLAPGLSMEAAVDALVVFEIGGVAGTFLSGFLSDLTDRKDVTSCAFSVGAVFSLSLFYFESVALALPRTAFYCCVYFLLGLALAGPKTVSGIWVRQLAPPKAAGTAGGILSLAVQLLAAMAGSPLGLIIQMYSWSYMFSTLLLAMTLSSILFLYLIVADRRPGCAKHKDL